MLLCGVFVEEILAALGHLPEYPTCSKAMSWSGALYTMNFEGSIEPSFQYGSMPYRGFLLFCVRSHQYVTTAPSVKILQRSTDDIPTKLHCSSQRRAKSSNATPQCPAKLHCNIGELQRSTTTPSGKLPSLFMTMFKYGCLE